MFLETERLKLRKFQEIDIDDFCELVIDSERNHMMGNDEILSVDEAKGLLEWFMHREERAYGIVLKATGRVVGNLTVYNEPSDEVNTPAASNGASNLQRCRAAGYLTLAAFAKYPCKHDYLAHCSRE